MDESLVEFIVTQVLNRLKKRVLIILTKGEGYKCEIYNRLSQYKSLTFSIMIADNAVTQHPEDKWCHLGNIVKPDMSSLSADLSNYASILVPFMDFETLGEISNGLFSSDSARVINYALLQQRKVVALDYNCNPHSELNQVLGIAKNSAYAYQIQHNINVINDYGIVFCNINEVEETLLSTVISLYSDEIKNSSCRYITLNEVMHNSEYSISSSERFTDLAIEYLKSHKSK